MPDAGSSPRRTGRSLLGATTFRRHLKAPPSTPSGRRARWEPDPGRPHPRAVSWVGASARALGGSNQSIFVIGALLLSQGTMAVPLLAVGLLLSYLATPGWIELSCMFPNRVGGIAAARAGAFRPCSAVLANLTGVCCRWGWVPTCGLTAIFSAEATQEVIPGTGLGLAIVQAIVQAIVEHHGGVVNLASAPGQGTTVRVRLPSVAAAETRRELDAQDPASAADRGVKDLMPVGVAASDGGAHAPDAGQQSGEDSKEHPR